MDAKTIISILALLVSFIGLYLSRKDKNKKDDKDDASNQALVNYKIDELTKKVDKIIANQDNSRTEVKAEIERSVNEAIQSHIIKYHSN